MGANYYVYELGVILPRASLILFSSISYLDRATKRTSSPPHPIRVLYETPKIGSEISRYLPRYVEVKEPPLCKG